MVNSLLVAVLVLAAIQITLLIVAIVDWSKQPQDMPNRILWLVLIILINLIGPILYFLVAPRGRYETEEDQAWTME